jgi:hypothetical protein
MGAGSVSRKVRLSMFRQFWTIIWWLFRIGVMIWFVLMPILPLYGWLSPWPDAEQKLEADGVKGIKLMVGGGGSSERENDRWSEERQRSYVVIPSSLRSMEIFTYQEAKGSHVTGIDRQVIRSRWVVQLFVLWILAGWFVSRTGMLLWTRLKRANQPLQATAATLSS